jgi:two-component system chemotaxis response regulator CheY
MIQPRVLVVDDSSLARRTTRQALEQSGYAVEEAVDGMQALERYFLQPYDLVILDMVMAGMYGLDVLAKIREIKPDARVLVATADIQKSTVEKVRAAGAVGILNKPIPREVLVAAAARVLEGEQLWS